MLLAQGLDHADIARLNRTGELRRIRRGAYERGADVAATVEQRHERRIAGTVPQLETGAVISHASAAVLHGLPVPAASLDRVHLSRDRNYGARRRGEVEVHCAPLPAADLCEVDGIPVTSMARTVVDLARSWSFEQGVSVGDHALRVGATRHELETCLAGMSHWPMVRQARQVVAFLDARSESVGESMSRVLIRRDGLHDPVPQLEIRGLRGEFVARVDFAWEEYRTIGEFDGRIKYGRLLGPGQTIDDVVFAEKQREDALRDLGWQVVRWLRADLYAPGVVRDRLRRAFARHH